MRNDGQRHPGRANGFIPTSFRALSSYLRIVSSGASSVARSAASAASAIVERDNDNSHDQFRAVDLEYLGSNYPDYEDINLDYSMEGL
ncbi:hypothetical protein C3L33_11615, partial [Rhododendron williamsianum]